MQLNIKKYHFLENKSADKKHYGMIAQEVEKIFPEVVYHKIMDSSHSDLYAMNYNAFRVISIKVIQEQQATIDSLKSDIHELKTIVARLAQKLEESSGTFSQINDLSAWNKTNPILGIS